MKGFDFSQSCILNDKKSKGTFQKGKVVEKNTINEQFKEDEINMAMAMKPIFSNHKKRK